MPALEIGQPVTVGRNSGSGPGDAHEAGYGNPAYFGRGVRNRKWAAIGVAAYSTTAQGQAIEDGHMRPVIEILALSSPLVYYPDSRCRRRCRLTSGSELGKGLFADLVSGKE